MTLLCLAGFLGVLLAGSWQRWGDLTIDCGGSVDLVARLASGEVLYRDVLSPYGPLPPYILAALMRVFGIHLNVVYGVGLCLLFGASVAWWAIARRFLSEVETAAGLAAFWALLALQPGVFNWVLPNTFANSFGAFFSLAMVAALLSDLQRPRNSIIVAASVLAAAAGLSKIEFGVATAGTLVIWVILTPRTRRSRGYGLVLGLLPGASMTVLVAGAVLLTVPWQTLLADNLYRTRTFERSVGVYRDFGTSMAAAAWPLEILWCFVLVPLQVCAVSAGLAGWGRGWRKRWASLALVALGASPVVLALGVPHFLQTVWASPGLTTMCSPFLEIGGAWGFTWSGIGWLGAAAVVGYRHRSWRVPASGAIFLVALSSLLQSLRWGLHPMWPAFFAPMAPALLLLIVRWPASRLFPHTSRLAAALVVALVASAVGYNWFRFAYSQRAPSLTSSRGTVRAPDANAMRGVVEYLRMHTTPTQFVAVVPEERFVNFFAERRHPTRDPGVGPHWLVTAGDRQRFIEELAARETALVVISRRTYPEFGVGRFDEYEPEIMAWLRERYRPAFRNLRYAVFEPRRPRD